MLKYLVATLLISLSAFSLAQTAQNTVYSKFNYKLERLIVETQNARKDLRSVFIVGILRTAADVDTPHEIAALFKDKNTKVRAIILSPDGNIVTFSSSLFGVLNAAQSPNTYSIQMSQKVDGTAGVTIRN